MTDTDLARLYAQLELHEGRRRKPYHDTVGKLTIGVGRNLSDVGVSDDEIDLMLDNDVARAVGSLAAKLPWFVTLDVVRQRVLIDMTFNMGIDGLLEFRNTLAAVRRGDWRAAAAGMAKSKWARQVGDGPGGRLDRAERLQQMMSSGHDYVV